MAEAPQHCPNKDCRASLKDRTVPPGYRRWRRLFTRALVDDEAQVRPGQTGWKCPDCDHRWYGAGNFLDPVGSEPNR